MITNQLLRQTCFWTFCCISLLIAQTLFAQQPPWRLTAGTEGRYFSAITVYASNPDTLYAIGQGFFRSTDRGEHWDSIAIVSAAGGALKTDPFNSRIIYASTDGPSGNRIQISTNGGITWQVKFTGLQCAAPIVEIDPADRRTVYVGVAPSRIMRSSNYGQTWDTLPAPPIFCINDFKIASSSDSIMYAAYSEGIYKSVDKGQTWTQTGFPTYAHFLAIHPLDPQIVYAAVQSSGNEPRGVYKTTNGGATWVQRNGGLDSLQGYDWAIGDIVVNPVLTEEIYLGVRSLRGRFLYRSTNGGSLWLNFSEGFPDSGGVAAIEVDTLNHRVYTAAAGWARSGIYVLEWLTDVKNEEPQLVHQFILDQNYPNPFNPVTTIRYSIPRRASVTLTVYDILGREVRVLWQGLRGPGTYSVRFDAQQLTSGMYIYSLKADSRIVNKKALLLK
jgi:photosystem II stability/assembly factor-like uncharacterized protein